MSTPTIEKILSEFGKLPRGLVATIHEAREGNSSHKPGHHTGQEQELRLTQEQFRHYLVEVLSDHYQAHHPGTRREATCIYISKTFGSTIDEMWRGYDVGHHTLEQYAEVLSGSPRE